MPKPSITKISLKFTYLKFNSNLLGANELTRPDSITVLSDSRFSEHIRGVSMKDTGSYFLIFYHQYAVCLIDCWGLLTHWSSKWLPSCWWEFFNAFYLIKIYILFDILLTFVSKAAIDNNSNLYCPLYRESYLLWTDEQQCTHGYNRISWYSLSTNKIHIFIHFNSNFTRLKFQKHLFLRFQLIKDGH